MSGIFAVFRPGGRPVASRELDAMAQALGGRGTDARGTWIDERSEVGLGHLAMHCVPEDALAAQPIVDRETGIALVADARLDDRAALETALGIATARASERSDAGLVLEAFKRWGRDAPSRLYGDFTFLAWDPARRALFGARDPLGGRSLFYHRAGNALLLASAPKGLFALPEVPRRLDLRKVADALALLVDAEASFYEGVRRLPAAHALAACRGELTLRRYFRLDRSFELRLPNDDEYVERFRELFDAAVRDRLRSTHPVGAFLSGGLDSASVACVAASQLARAGRTLSTFTSVPRPGFAAACRPGWYDDETPFVETLRHAWPNLRPSYVQGAERSPLDDLERLFSSIEAPPRNPDNRPWLESIRELAGSRGIRVLLNGQGGNATVSFHGLTLFGVLARSGRWLRLHSELGALARARGRTRRRLFSAYVLAPWRRAGGARPAAAPWAGYSAIHPAFAIEQRLADRCAEHSFNLWQGRAFRAQWIEEGANEDARDVAQAWRSRFGVETRDPTFDRRVVEFCLAVPDDQFLRRGHDRWLIRRALAGTVPTAVLQKTTRGAQVPDWYERLDRLRPEFAAEIEALARSPTARHCLDVPRLRGLVERWPTGAWDGVAHEEDYRFLLLRGVVMGRFLRWVEESGRAGLVPAEPARETVAAATVGP